jgi:type II restriction/modification system DNA methylase subunit YeeA
MREQSSAPRNTRELAVRNQFFTPRYVVEFLTDNTLGRIWFEMTKGQTRLKEQCRYLVCRPNEIYLEQDQQPPNDEPRPEDLSQEEIPKQPVYIPHRPLKDPRSIRMLDPACGSMHFGLYAFDLLEVIYDEAWEVARGSDDILKCSEAFALSSHL